MKEPDPPILNMVVFILCIHTLEALEEMVNVYFRKCEHIYSSVNSFRNIFWET